MSTVRESLQRQVDQLRAAGTAHCIVTVVRTADTTSAKAGAKALVTTSGELHGFIGGACVQRSAIRVAGEVLRSGEPRMISVRPAAAVDTPFDADGVELHSSACPSGGTVDLFIEPFTVPVQLAICGASPVAVALASMGRDLGYRVVVAAAPGASWPAAPCDLHVENFQLDKANLCTRDAVVVTTQGRGDRDALLAALGSNAGYVGMVTSARKLEVLRERLQADLPPERLARLRGPAGLDIGAIEPEEIALSILAQIVAQRRRGHDPGGH